MAEMLQKNKNVANNVVNENSQDLTNYDILKEYEAHNTPLPSYDEWQEKLRALDAAYKTIKMEDETINRLVRSGKQCNCENAQLKELLKECKEIFDECFSPSAKHGELYKKIDEALK